MATERQVAANRVNGLKGGVKSEEGKAVSRLNARKHGIFATALTECDAEELRGIEGELIADLKPAGIVEEMLVEKLAATYLRMQRCARAEAHHYKEMWAEKVFPFVRRGHEKRVAAIGLYDMRLTNQFVKLLHEVEQRQKARRVDGILAGRVTAWNRALRPDVTLDGPEGPSHLEEMKNEPNSPGKRPAVGEGSRDIGSENLAKVCENLRKVQPEAEGIPCADFSLDTDDSV